MLICDKVAFNSQWLTCLFLRIEAENFASALLINLLLAYYAEIYKIWRSYPDRYGGAYHGVFEQG